MIRSDGIPILIDLIEQLLNNRINGQQFSDEYAKFNDKYSELNWNRDLSDPMDRMFGTTEMYNPEGLASGDTDFAGDQELREDAEQLLAALKRVYDAGPSARPDSG